MGISMKKRILIGCTAVVIIIAVIFLAVFLKTRNNNEHRQVAAEPKHTAGVWKDGLSVTVKYGSFEEAFGVYVVDENSRWSLEQADDTLYEVTESAAAGAGIGSVFELTAKKAGSGSLVLTNEEKILTIALSADEEGVFTVSGVTEGAGASSNADKVGYDILVEKYVPDGIPDVAEVVMIDRESEAKGTIGVLINYQDSSMWYTIKKSKKKADAAAKKYGKVVTDQGWSTISWKANGKLHKLEAEEGQEKNLTALYQLLAK